jgi:CheY-like chemotaxis protein
MDPKAHRVLVVEDNRDVAESLRRLLVACGCQVVVAHTSRDGLKAAREFEPDIVLCDIGLPDADGHVVGSVLRQSNPGSRLVAVTGHGRPEDRLRALAAGFDQHLVKPVDPRVLFCALPVSV